jgi:TfoX/Sxy family transcriptional regulator of competence genes
MGTSKSTMDFLLDQLSGVYQVSAKKMFGEYCLYLADKPIALVCDDQLFIKPTSAGRGLISKVIEGYPYPGAKPHFLVTADLWEEREWLGRLIQVTANKLPQPKLRKKKPDSVTK